MGERIVIMPSSVAQYQDSIDRTPRDIIDTGTGLGAVAKETDIEAEGRTGIWAKPITKEEAQMHARQFRFQNELGKIVDGLVDARQIQSRGSTIPEREELKTSMLDIIYSGEIPGIPLDLIYEHNGHQSYFTKKEFEANAWLISQHTGLITEKWTKCKDDKDISAKRRSYEILRTTKNILLGKQSSSDVYRAIGYPPDQVTRIESVRRKSLPTNLVVLLASDQGTNAVAGVTGHTPILDPIPEPIKYGLFFGALIGYYALLGLTVDKVRKIMESDPDVTPSFPGYTAFPIMQKLFAEEEVHAKQATYALAHLGLNPVEVGKEVIWDTYPIWSSMLWSPKALETRIGGDLAAMVSLAVQYGGLPHLNKVWRKGANITKKVRTQIGMNRENDLS